VKLLKLLTVPAVLLFCVVMAVPASAHHITQVTLGQTCDKENGQICIELKGQILPGTDERIVTLDLLGKKGSAAPTKVGEVTIDVPANHGNKAVPFDSTKCFGVVGGTFDSFSISWVKVTNAAGESADLSIALTSGTTFTEKDLPATLVPDIKPCTSTPASPPASSSPSASASAATTVALAQTGGFDFRFPLIGLTVLVAGLALFLVSASRGRRSTGSK